MTRMTTLLDLVDAVAEYARSDAELIATVVYMVNRGQRAARRDVQRITVRPRVGFGCLNHERRRRMSIIPGTRCRSTRTIVCRGGIVRRSTPGTLVSQRENLGRELFTVDFDSGQKVILFAHEIELEHDEPPRRRPGATFSAAL